MNKDSFIAAHEELIEAYMDEFSCDWQTAYDATADAAYDAARDVYWDRVDAARQRRKDGER